MQEYENFKIYQQSVFNASLSLEEDKPEREYAFHFNRNQALAMTIEITGNRDKLPLQTCNYYTILTSIRLQKPTPVFLQKLTPLSISDEEMQDSEYFNIVGKRILEKRRQAEKNFPNCLLIYLELSLLDKYLLKDLNRIPTYGKAQDEVQRIYISRFEVGYQFPIKLQFQRYNRFFCSICNLFCCPLHFIIKNQCLYTEREPQDLTYDVLEIDPLFDDNYKTLYKPNQISLKKMIDKYDKSLEMSIKCPQCTNSNQKLKKFYIESIKQLQLFGFTNPCFIYRIIQMAKYPITCGQVKELLKQNQIQTETIEKIDRIKKQKNQVFNKTYLPCFHEGDCGNQCECIMCHKWCCCQGKCKQSRQGCDCIDCGIDSKKQKNYCPCYNKQMECDPSICKCRKCANQNITNQTRKPLVLSRSLICSGLGCFAAKDFKAFEFVGEYIGNYILLENECHELEMCDQMTGLHYLFEQDETWEVDGTFFGNKTRFINHCTNVTGVCNCHAQVLFAKGQWRIAFFTTKQVKLGEELFFDYGDQFSTPWLTKFNELAKSYK